MLILGQLSYIVVNWQVFHVSNIGKKSQSLEYKRN